MPRPITGRRWRIPLLAATVLALVAAAAITTLTRASAATIVAGTWYTLTNVHSGKLLDIENNSTADAALVRQWTNTGCQCQQFRFESAGTGYWRLIARHSGKAIDLWEFNTADGADYRQWPITTGYNQQFSVQDINGNIQLINRHSGKALEVWAWSTTDGGRVSQYTDTNGANQQWRLTTVGGSTPGGRTWSNTADGFAAGTNGGAGGTTVTVTNQADLERYANAGAAHVIRVNGTITISPMGKEIRVGSNKTIVGVGTGGQIVNGGFFIGAGVSNVIIRNLTIRDTRMADDDPGDDAYDYDAIQIDTASRIWIDHNLLTRMNDGLLDSRKDTTDITVSWNVLADNNKTFGIGWTENVTARMTVHHNWFRSTNSRNPSADNLQYIHMYNNYLQNVTGYGNYARGATKMVIENSYFENVKDPFYKDTAAQLRQSGSVLVNCTGKQQAGGSAFTPGSFYSYTLDSAASVPGLLRTYAGPQANIGL